MKRPKSSYLALMAILLSPMAANANPIVAITPAPGDADSFETILTPTNDNCGPAGAFCGGMVGGFGTFFLGADQGGGIFSIVEYLFQADGLTFDSATTVNSFLTFDLNTNLLTGILQVRTQGLAGLRLQFEDGGYASGVILSGFFIRSQGIQTSLPISTPDPTPVPEPGSLTLLCMGLLGLGLARKKSHEVKERFLL